MMLNELTVIPTNGEVSDRLARYDERVRELSEKSKADRTRKTYAYQFARFTAWCVAHKLSALPAAPKTLARYLTYLSDHGTRPSTLNLVRAAVCHAHDAEGHPFNGKDREVREVLAGAKRQSPEIKQARPFTLDMLHALEFGSSLEDVRDKAMFYLGLARALRGPSELIALDLDKIGTPDARGYLEIGRVGATIQLQRSKTAQTSRQAKNIDHGPAVEAVEAWIKAARITAGTPLWRIVGSDYVRPERMSARTWDRIVKRRAEQAMIALGMDAEQAKDEAAEFSTHSLRAGMITSLDEDGATIAEICAVTGHAPGSANVVLGYTRRQDGGAKRIKKLGL